MPKNRYLTGPYQVGTKIQQDQCVLGGNNIWSAAYQVPQQQGITSLSN